MKRLLVLGTLGAVLAITGMLGVAGLASAHGPWGGFGGMGSLNRGEHEAAMAKALGVTVEKLRSAQDQMFQDGLAKAQAAGKLTQEQVDLMKAGRKLQESIDYEAIMAQALGVTTADLQKATTDGKTPQDLATASGLDRQALSTKLQAAQEAAVAKAVADGVITQTQADALKNAGGKAGMGRHGLFGRGFGHGGCTGGWGTKPGDAGKAVPDKAAPDASGAQNGNSFFRRQHASSGVDL